MILRDRGAKSDKDVFKDKHQYDFQANFPECSPARTTFYANDIQGNRKTGKFNRLWSLQHGRGHTYEGWDGQRVRPEDEFTYRRARAILSQADVGCRLRELVGERVVKEDLTGFSRYYEGIDGAALGFATLYRYQSQTAAMASYLVNEAERLLDVDGEKLVDYVWRKYDVQEGGNRHQ